MSIESNNTLSPLEPRDEGVIEMDINDSEDEASKVYLPKDVLHLKSNASTCWSFFHFKQHPDKDIPDLKKVYCNLCGAVLNYNQSTSTLNRHVTSSHEAAYEEELKKSEVPQSGTIDQFLSAKSTSSKKKNKWPYSSPRYIEATKLLTKWVCKNSRPISIVEDEGFLELLDYLCPEYKVPTHTTISNYIKAEYKVMKQDVKEELKNIEFMAGSTDGGTSINAVSFQDTNVHVITNNWELRSYTLSVRENKEKHTAENYRANTDECYDDFEIKDKITVNTTDNENKMKAAFKDPERNGCMAHILHNTVTHGFKKIETVMDIIVKCRKVAERHNRSYAFRYALEVEQKKLNIKQRPLHQDVPTRWGSTRVCTSSFLDKVEGAQVDSYRNFEAVNNALKSINLSRDQLDKLTFSKDEMKKVDTLNRFLTDLDIYSTTLGGNVFVTGSIVVPLIKTIKKKIEPDDNDPRWLSELKDAMMEDFVARTEKDLNWKLLHKATAVDPRFKNLKVIPDWKRENVWAELKAEMEILHSNNFSSSDIIEDGDSQPSLKKRHTCLDFSESESSSDEENGPEDVVRAELDNFKREPLLDRDSDALKWWSEHEKKFPILQRLAKKYLCIPATSVEAERTFSALGVVLTKRRLSMTGANVDMQLFLKDKYKKS